MSNIFICLGAFNEPFDAFSHRVRARRVEITYN